jgi:RNA polymerase sigma-70 factor (ECF subfamily)
MKGKLVALRRTDGVPAEMSDEALMSACAVGDVAALAALFDRYHAHVLRFVARMASTDQQDIDDLVQATFLELQRSAHRFEARAPVKTWIFGIAANVARHHARRESRRRLFSLAYSREPERVSLALDDLVSDRQRLACLGRALHELPHDLRVAFVMCDLEGMAGVDAARALGLREGTLFRRLHDARMRLRASLQKDGR